MSFVKGKFCYGCNVFVLQSAKNHVCPQKHNEFVQKDESSCNVLNIPPTESTNLFESLSDNDEIQSTSLTDIPKKGKYANMDHKVVGVSKENMIDLITSVEVSRPLWNIRMSLAERSESIKNNLWNKIFLQFNGKYSIQGLKKSWKYLKERYTREKKAGVSGSAGDKKEWPYFNYLRFLDEVSLVEKCTVDNLRPNCIENTSNQKEDRKSIKRSALESQMGLMIEELKHSRPIPPPDNLYIESESNDDTKFSSYLPSLMAELPKKKKIILQGKLIAIVIEQINDHTY